MASVPQADIASQKRPGEQLPSSPECSIVFLKTDKQLLVDTGIRSHPDSHWGGHIGLRTNPATVRAATVVSPDANCLAT
eukprot:3940125-Amphidinium_carterae.1